MMEHAMGIPDGIERVLLSEEKIAARVAEMAAQISADYEDDDELVLVGGLMVSCILLADRWRRRAVRPHVDFIALASYEGSESSGSVRLIMDTRNDLSGRHVLIVEDILDTGHTLDYLTQVFNARHPASLRTCVMLRKKEREEVAVNV